DEQGLQGAGAGAGVQPQLAVARPTVEERQHSCRGTTAPPGRLIHGRFLQMGWTRARRYANHRGGRKYDRKSGQELPRGEDAEKARPRRSSPSATSPPASTPAYVRLKKDQRERYEGGEARFTRSEERGTAGWPPAPPPGG